MAGIQSTLLSRAMLLCALLVLAGSSAAGRPRQLPRQLLEVPPGYDTGDTPEMQAAEEAVGKLEGEWAGAGGWPMGVGGCHHHGGGGGEGPGSGRQWRGLWG